MITSVQSYGKYFEGIRRRSLKYIRTIPPDRIDWSPDEGRFTCGDLVRHLAAAEKMYIGVVLDDRWLYTGHNPDDHNRTLAGAIDHLNTIHEAAMQRLSTLPDSELDAPRATLVPNTRPVKVWRWLMAMVEHEIHHRSELASYLTQLGVVPPQIYDISVEELTDLAHS